MSVLLDVKQTCEDRLATAFPSTPIAYEGAKFVVPNELYLRTQFLIQTPEDPTIGDKYYRERITFQVFVCDLLNKGSINALVKAEEIRQLFDKGLFLQQNDTRIHVLRTPQVSSGTVAMDRYVVPVLINLIAEVYKD